MLDSLNTVPDVLRSAERAITDWLNSMPAAPNIAALDSYNSASADSINTTIDNNANQGNAADNPQGNWLLDQLATVLDSLDFVLEFAEAVEAVYAGRPFESPADYI